MKIKCFFIAIMILTLSSTFGFAKIYVNEGFEQFAEGVDIGQKSDFWEMTEPADNPVGAGIASSKQAHTGKISALFDKGQCMGFPFANLKLPGNYIVSTWFYHDSKQTPPPDAIVILIPDAYPGGGNFWIGMGTRTQAVVLQDYAYRDKTGTGIYEDTKVPRRTEWVQFVFAISPNATDLYVDGKKVYTAKIAATRYNGYEMSRTPAWGAQTGEVFIDDVIVADKMEEVPQADLEADKLAATWGKIKLY